MKRGERGQSLVEGTLVMLVFFALMFGVIDCGQVLVAHQALVERVRSASRWGVVHPWDGTGEQIANLILYNQPEEPRSTRLMARSPRAHSAPRREIQPTGGPRR